MNFIDNTEDDEIDFLLERVKKGKILKVKEKIDLKFDCSYFVRVDTKYINNKYIHYLSDSISYKETTEENKKIVEQEKENLKKYIISSLQNCDDFSLETYEDENYILTTYEYAEEPDDVFIKRLSLEKGHLLFNERKKIKQLLKESTRNVLIEKNKKKKRGRPKKSN